MPVTAIGKSQVLVSGWVSGKDVGEDGRESTSSFWRHELVVTRGPNEDGLQEVHLLVHDLRQRSETRTKGRVLVIDLSGVCICMSVHTPDSTTSRIEIYVVLNFRSSSFVSNKIQLIHSVYYLITC